MWHTSRHMKNKTSLTMDPSRMKKMPPPGKMPPNGNGRSRMNGRAEEPSHGERIAQLEVLIQNCATKTDLERLRAELKTEMAELRGEMAEFKGEMKAEMAALRAEMKAEMAALRADMHANFVSTLRWTLGVLLGVIVPFFSAVLAILKFL